MHAAAEGKSTLGIPKKVAREFVAADKPGKLPEKAKDERNKNRTADRAVARISKPSPVK